MVHINQITRVQIKNLILMILVLPVLSFTTTVKKINNNNLKSIVSVYSFEDLLCPSFKESALTIKINNVYDNTKSYSNFPLFNSNGRVRSSLLRSGKTSRAKNSNQSPKLPIKQIDSNLVRSNELVEKENSQLSIQKANEKTNENRISYQAKANKAKEHLSIEIQQAIYWLKDFNCPSFTITSTYRCWGGKKHRIGKAIDVHYTKEMTSWLVSEDGIKWLKEYNLIFYIEDWKPSSKKKLSEKELEHWRWVGHATNLHIHIEIK